MATLGERLRAARTKTGMSQGEVAKLLPGRGRYQTISAWEHDKAVPDSVNLAAVAKLYRVSVDELLAQETPQALKPPDSAPALKTWVTGQLASITLGMNEYLEKIIEREVTDRLEAATTRLATDRLLAALDQLHRADPALAAKAGGALRELLGLPPAPATAPAKSPGGQVLPRQSAPAIRDQPADPSPTSATQDHHHPRRGRSA